VLEGGYDLQALASSVREVVEELGRDAAEPLAPGAPDREAWLLEKVMKELSPFWNF